MDGMGYLRWAADDRPISWFNRGRGCASSRRGHGCGVPLGRSGALIGDRGTLRPTVDDF